MSNTHDPKGIGVSATIENMKIEPAWWANIYVGLDWQEKGMIFFERVLREECQKYCEEVGFCVTFTPTTFIYSNGNEPGVIVGCIQYPRFPLPNEQNRERAIALAKRLMSQAHQKRVSIMMPDEVVMLSKEDDDA
jgi:hypothetical protein